MTGKYRYQKGFAQGQERHLHNQLFKSQMEAANKMANRGTMYKYLLVGNTAEKCEEYNF